MDKKISIIVPVYNLEKYLPRCLNSVCNQTYKNLEIILVDDGSTDKSSDICDNWAKKDSRIIVIHKKNGGVSSARNAGIKKATGEYIHFVDGDDWLELNCYEKIVELNSNKTVMFNAYFVNSRDKFIKFNYDFSEINNQKEMIYKLISGDLGYTNCWSRIFCRDIIEINELFFDESISVGEDFLFLYKYLKCIDELYCINEPLYNNDISRDTSAMNVVNEGYLNKWMVTESILKEEYNEFELKKGLIRRLYKELEDTIDYCVINCKYKSCFDCALKTVKRYYKDYNDVNEKKTNKKIRAIMCTQKLYWHLFRIWWKIKYEN